MKNCHLSSPICLDSQLTTVKSEGPRSRLSCSLYDILSRLSEYRVCLGRKKTTV